MGCVSTAPSHGRTRAGLGCRGSIIIEGEGGGGVLWKRPLSVM